MKGKTIIITGGSLGIGAAAARVLRERGATVAITGRSEETMRHAAAIGAQGFLADFASFNDVRALAMRLLETYPRIDVLVNNVGGIMNERSLTVDGHERTLQVNHLSGFLLTNLLRKRLEDSGATVINTSSGAHRMGRIDFDDLEEARAYSAWRAYGSAKLMNILHAAELNRRFRGVHGVSFHPGVVRTGFARSGSPFWRSFYSGIMGKLLMLSPEKGADTMIWLATTRAGKDWSPGEYYVKGKLSKKSGAASDPVLARRLWDVSEEMTR